MSNEKEIRDFLKKYQVEDEEIEKFMAMLVETKEDIQENEEKGDEQEAEIEEKEEIVEEQPQEEEKADYSFNAKNIEMLKATEKGKDLIINAPTMAKEELEEAIKNYLEENKN